MRLDGPQGVGQQPIQKVIVGSNEPQIEEQTPQLPQIFDTSGTVAEQNQGKGYAMQFEGNDNAFSNAPTYTEADFRDTIGANGKKVKTGFSKSERQKLATEYNNGNRDMVDPYGDIQKYLVKENNPIADSYLDELAAYKPKAPLIQPTYDETFAGIRQNARELLQNINDVKSGYEEAKEKSRLEAKIDRNAGLTLGVGAALTDQIDQATGAVLASNEEQTQQLEGDINKAEKNIKGAVKAETKEIKKQMKKDAVINMVDRTIEHNETLKAIDNAAQDVNDFTLKQNVQTRDHVNKVVKMETDYALGKLDPDYEPRKGSTPTGDYSIEDALKGGENAFKKLKKGVIPEKD